MMTWKDSQSLLWTIALILFVRGFIVEPFKIPSGSMIPTILIGDHIFVAKSSYDIGVPFTNISLIRISDPKRGDVVVFRYPNYEENPRLAGLNYIKRVIGIPGDRVVVKEGVPYISGVAAGENYKGVSSSVNEIPGFVGGSDYSLRLESLPGSRHPYHWVQRLDIVLEELGSHVDHFEDRIGRRCLEVGEGKMPGRQIISPLMFNEICEFEIPEDHYFVVGDNRDASSDGRDFGLLERKYLRGRALFVWLSLLLGEEAHPDEGSFFVRWSRLGHPVR